MHEYKIHSNTFHDYMHNFNLYGNTFRDYRNSHDYNIDNDAFQWSHFRDYATQLGCGGQPVALSPLMV